PPDERLVERVVHHHFIRVHGTRTRSLADAERIEGREGVRPELDARADFTQPRRLLEHLDFKTVARERKRRGQPPNAASRDEDRKCCGRAIHCRLLLATAPVRASAYTA